MLPTTNHRHLVLAYIAYANATPFRSVAALFIDERVDANGELLLDCGEDIQPKANEKRQSLCHLNGITREMPARKVTSTIITISV